MGSDVEGALVAALDGELERLRERAGAAGGQAQECKD
jgi:hypothetical protein